MAPRGTWWNPRPWRHMNRKSPRASRIVRGLVASYEPMLPASVFAKQGRQLRYEAHWALRQNERTRAEKLYRRAIERLVDAFLVDRRRQQEAFVVAHRVGRQVLDTFGCPMRSDDGGANWETRCGILALHQRIGSSFGGPTSGQCSICGAEDFECVHVPGRRYGDDWYVREIYNVDLREVSYVSFPGDPRCYRTEALVSRAEVEKAYGGPLPAGVVPECTHCVDCRGAKDGPAPKTWIKACGSGSNPQKSRVPRRLTFASQPRSFACSALTGIPAE